MLRSGSRQDQWHSRQAGLQVTSKCLKVFSEWAWLCGLNEYVRSAPNWNLPLVASTGHRSRCAGLASLVQVAKLQGPDQIDGRDPHIFRALGKKSLPALSEADPGDVGYGNDDLGGGGQEGRRLLCKASRQERG